VGCHGSLFELRVVLASSTQALASAHSLPSARRTAVAVQAQPLLGHAPRSAGGLPYMGFL